MNFLIDQRKAIEKAFKAGFVAGEGEDALPPVQYENQPFTQPAGKAWSRLSIAGGADTGLEIGGTFGRMIGVVYLSVFIPENEGVDAFNRAAVSFAGVFNLQTFIVNASVITFRRVGVMPVGKDQGTGMFQRNAYVDFQHDTYGDAAFPPQIIAAGTVPNVRFIDGDLYLYNTDAATYQKWEPRGTGDDAHLELTSN